MTCSNTSSRLMTNLGRDLKRYSPYTVDISIHIHDHRSLLTGCFIYRLNSIFQLEYIVHHQQFLEALSWQGGGGHRHALLPWKADGNPAGEMDGELEVEVVVELLKSLEKLCPSQVSRAPVKKRKKVSLVSSINSIDPHLQLMPQLKIGILFQHPGVQFSLSLSHSRETQR